MSILVGPGKLGVADVNKQHGPNANSPIYLRWIQDIATKEGIKGKIQINGRDVSEYTQTNLKEALNVGIGTKLTAHQLYIITSYIQTYLTKNSKASPVDIGQVLQRLSETPRISYSDVAGAINPDAQVQPPPTGPAAETPTPPISPASHPTAPPPSIVAVAPPAILPTQVAPKLERIQSLADVTAYPSLSPDDIKVRSVDHNNSDDVPILLIQYASKKDMFKGIARIATEKDYSHLELTLSDSNHDGVINGDDYIGSLRLSDEMEIGAAHWSVQQIVDAFNKSLHRSDGLKAAYSPMENKILEQLIVAGLIQKNADGSLVKLKDGSIVMGHPDTKEMSYRHEFTHAIFRQYESFHKFASELYQADPAKVQLKEVLGTPQKDGGLGYNVADTDVLYTEFISFLFEGPDAEWPGTKFTNLFGDRLRDLSQKVRLETAKYMPLINPK